MGPLQRREHAIFTSVWLRPDSGSKPSFREVCTEGLPPWAWAGQRASQHAWPQGPFWSLTLRYAVTHTEFCQQVQVWCAGDVSVEWILCLRGRQALQSVGNLGLQLGHGKEQWMAPLHPIILRSVASVKDFLDKLIDIDHDIGETEHSEHNQRWNVTTFTEVLYTIPSINSRLEYFQLILLETSPSWHPRDKYFAFHSWICLTSSVTSYFSEHTVLKPSGLEKTSFFKCVYFECLAMKCSFMYWEFLLLLNRAVHPKMKFSDDFLTSMLMESFVVHKAFLELHGKTAL